MSSPIVPTQGPTLSEARAMPASSQMVDPTAFYAQLRSNGRITSQAIPDSPPAEVLDQIAAAERVSQQLTASGHHLQFDTVKDGRASVQVKGPDGEHLRNVSVAEALDIVAGKPPS